MPTSGSVAAAAACSVIVSVNCTQVSPSAPPVGPSVRVVTVKPAAGRATPESWIRIRRRLPAETNSAGEGVNVQLFTAEAVPSSTPLSPEETDDQVPPPSFCVFHIVIPKPSLALMLDSKPHTLQVIVPLIVTAFTGGDQKLRTAASSTRVPPLATYTDDEADVGVEVEMTPEPGVPIAAHRSSADVEGIECVPPVVSRYSFVAT